MAIVVLVALSGVASLVHGVQMIGQGDVAFGLLDILMGLLLCHRVYLVYWHTRSSHLITVILLSLRVVLALAALITGTLAIESAIIVILAGVALLYLVQPEVRALFASDR